VATVFSPAKLNLFLAVTGRRADGFHDLVSVAVPMEFGDDLEAEERASGFSLECNDAAVPMDGSNLVLRAAAAFAAATGWKGGAHFRLTKRIPLGAGLGGGSSNAVAALRALEQLRGEKLAPEKLAALAAGLGSDCALFLHNAPVAMRGRGERVDKLPDAAARRLRGRPVLVFKPSFGIATPWAYKRMVERGTDYIPAEVAERRLAEWIAGDVPAGQLLGNNMEPAAFEKYVGLPVLLEIVRAEFGLEPRMSGSGSACYALLADGQPAGPIIARIRECWGEGAFAVVTIIA
jgi:4-diphosphocytidyl-2-C-methyl-D-erythritol kinase